MYTSSVEGVRMAPDSFVSGHRIVEERARVPVQHHSRRADHGTEIDRSGLQQPRLRDNPDRQRLRIEAKLDVRRQRPQRNVLATVVQLAGAPQSAKAAFL